MQAPDADGAPPPRLRIDIGFPDDDTVVVTPSGEADIYDVDNLQRAVLNDIREGRPHVIVDLDQLTFMWTPAPWAFWQGHVAAPPQQGSACESGATPALTRGS